MIFLESCFKADIPESCSRITLSETLSVFYTSTFRVPNSEISGLLIKVKKEKKKTNLQR